MASIDFYTMPESPPCRTVELVAKLAGVKLNVKPINLFTGEHMQESYLKLNPWHKVPFIVDGDLKLNESRAIAMYLINKYMPADNKLYPQDPVKRAKVDELIQWELGTLYTAASKVFYPKIRTPHLPVNVDFENAYKDVLKIADSICEGKKFLLGDHYTLADVVMRTGLTFSEANEVDFSPYKNLKAWLDTCHKEIPHFAEINDKPTETMKNFIKSKVAEAQKQ